MKMLRYNLFAKKEKNVYIYMHMYMYMCAYIYMRIYAYIYMWNLHKFCTWCILVARRVRYLFWRKKERKKLQLFVIAICKGEGGKLPEVARIFNDISLALIILENLSLILWISCTMKFYKITGIVCSRQRRKKNIRK